MTETALSFETPIDGASLQFEMDTDGYSLTIFNGEDGDEGRTITLRGIDLTRLCNFIRQATNEGTI